jgi:hypothetical protein
LLYSPIFSAAVDNRPMAAPIGSMPGVEPTIAQCGAFSPCVMGPETHQYHWKFDFANELIYHEGSKLCLDVKGNTPTPGALVNLWTCNQSNNQKWERRPNTNPFSIVHKASNLCLTIAPLEGGNFVNPNVARSLSLQTCDNGDLQKFSTSDGSIVPPA